MSFNSFGRLFRFISFGESHGSAVGVVIDGVPAGLDFDVAAVQRELDRRRPGQTEYVTQRQELDRIHILSGVLFGNDGYRSDLVSRADVSRELKENAVEASGKNAVGKTMGSPIAMLVLNKDARSQDYENISQKFRPSHADMVYYQKYGIRDVRGGGRSSARETLARVAAGAVAQLVIPGVVVRASLSAVGEKNVYSGGKTFSFQDFEDAAGNELNLLDGTRLGEFGEYIKDIRKSGDSVGAMIELRARGVPAGWGSPVYDKLSSRLAGAIMGINAVKSVEIGDGARMAEQRGSQVADEYRCDQGGNLEILANHSGGILGGISTGQEIVLRCAIKPASSILQEKRSVDISGSNVKVKTEGRHDPCVGIRAVPVVEAMVKCVLADFYLCHLGQDNQRGSGSRF